MTNSTKLARALLPVLLMLLSMNCTTLRSDPAAKIVGDWEGMAGGQFPFTAQFDKADDVFTGSLTIPGAGVTDAPLIEMTLEGADIVAAFETARGVLSLEGVISEVGTVSGAYVWGSESAPFEMKRASND